MDHEQRAITIDEVASFRQALSLGFGKDAAPGGDERMLSLMPLARTVAVFDGEVIVGTLGDFPMQLTLPGGAQLAMAGTTMVTVRSTHTRQGILRSMMRQHLDNAVARGEAVAGLWASEPGIYGRFGFGLSAECHEVKIDSRRLTPPPVAEDLTLSMISAEEIPIVVTPFWSSIATDRAGFLERTDARWQDIINDPEHNREGGSAARHVVVRRCDQVVGYLDYRQHSKWDDFVAEGAISIGTLFASDNDAHRALWNHALSVDLFPNVDFWDAAVDDPLAYEINNARAVRRSVGDALYVRILDTERALGARSYEQDGALVIAVEDELGYAGGTYRLSVESGACVVAPTSDAADVSLGIRELGALYLGRSCTDLYASTGHITGSPPAIRTLGQLFATARAPWCPEMF